MKLLPKSCMKFCKWLLFKWFSSNFMKTNTDTSNPLMSCERGTT